MPDELSEHFTWAEARCRCGCEIPPDLKGEIQKTASWLEEVRAALGGRPMRVLSWYRCRSYNAKVGGAPNSQHLLGRAVDFVHKDISPRQTQAQIARKLYPDLVRGFGRYPGFTHVDRRSGPPATWSLP
jgi:uncharacterized protein YcbK (DUF882 family)